jgi:hypothetical protein
VKTKLQKYKSTLVPVVFVDLGMYIIIKSGRIFGGDPQSMTGQAIIDIKEGHVKRF